MVGTSTWFRLCILLAPVALGCGGRKTSEPPGGETNWLGACTTVADCKSGDCICNSCTLACSDSASCSAGPPASTCAVTGSSALAAMCGASPLPAGACLPPCSGGCPSSTICVADHCVPVHRLVADAGDAAVADVSADAVDASVTDAPPDAQDSMAPAPDARDSMAPETSMDAADSSVSKCPTGVAGHCSSASYPAYPGFTLALVEDFDEPIDLVNDPVWTYSDGFGDSYYTRYKKEALSFSGGALLITVTKPAGGVPGTDYPSYAEGTQTSYPVPVGAGTVMSGELRTKYNNYRYGRYELRTRAPQGNSTGNFVSMAFTSRTPKWQEWREIYIETTPANVATSVGTNIVFANNAGSYGGTLNSYSAKPIVTVPDGGTVFDDFHTYAFEILPTSVTWFVDGAQIRRETGTGVSLPEKSMKIMADLWVFNTSTWGGGSPLLNVYPMQSEIDWIRFYRSDQDPVYPCSPTPACLPVEDRDYSKNNAEDGIPSAAPW